MSTSKHTQKFVSPEKISGDVNAEVTRNDARYVTERDGDGVVLVASYNEMPLGAWTDDDAGAFRVAVEDELRHIVGPFPVDLSLISIEEV